MAAGSAVPAALYDGRQCWAERSGRRDAAIGAGLRPDHGLAGIDARLSVQPTARTASYLEWFRRPRSWCFWRVHEGSCELRLGPRIEYLDAAGQSVLSESGERLQPTDGPRRTRRERGSWIRPDRSGLSQHDHERADWRCERFGSWNDWRCERIQQHVQRTRQRWHDVQLEPESLDDGCFRGRWLIWRLTRPSR